MRRSVAYITSRNFRLPEADSEMSAHVWFNMWTRRLWPYRELEPGHILYYYESPQHVIRWKTRLRRVERFEYASKADAAARLLSSLGTFDQQQSYFLEAPTEGYCVAWKVEPLTRINLPRPRGFRFAQSGWMRFEDVEKDWPELAASHQ